MMIITADAFAAARRKKTPSVALFFLERAAKSMPKNRTIKAVGPMKSDYSF
jgi:hypothetical protein